MMLIHVLNSVWSLVYAENEFSTSEVKRFYNFLVSISLSFIKVNGSTLFLFPKSHVIADVFMGRSIYSCLQRITRALVEYFLHIFRTDWVKSRVKNVFGTSSWVKFRMVRKTLDRFTVGFVGYINTQFGCNRIHIKTSIFTLLINILKTHLNVVLVTWKIPWLVQK